MIFIRVIPEKKREGLEGTIFQDPPPIQIYKETNSSFF